MIISVTRDIIKAEKKFKWKKAKSISNIIIIIIQIMSLNNNLFAINLKLNF